MKQKSFSIWNDCNNFVLTDEMIDYISKTLTEATRLIIKKVEIEHIRIGGGGRKVVLGGR